MMNTMCARLRDIGAILLCAGLIALGGAGPAVADSPSSGGDVQVAQTFDGRELTVILRRITSVPGPLRVDVVSHDGDRAGRLTISALFTGGAPGSAPRGTVDLPGTPGMYGTTLPVDRAGPWELAIDDGTRVARIPFVASPQVTSPPERYVYGGFAAAGICLVATVVVATRSRRGGWALLPGAGLVAGIAVAVTAAVLSVIFPLPPQPGVQLDPTVGNVTDPYARSQPPIVNFSRPPVNLTVAQRTSPDGAELTIELSDAATGYPVDDLIVHDSALMHLLLISPSGRLSHVHPIRIAPGVFEVGLPAPEPGHYAVAAELSRRGGGVQQVRAAVGLDVAGSATVPVTNPAGAGRRSLGDAPVDIAVTDAVAGAPVTITATFGDRAELQPWLGMTGHMIVAGPLDIAEPAGVAAERAQLLAHVHSMNGSSGSMIYNIAPVNGDSPPDETVANLGPAVPFTYRFPLPGRYRVWIQAERGYRVLTVPVTVDIHASSENGGAP
ncbi:MULTISPECIES: hypothetical protein [unclassified Nocardia]|uniref:hypothetical protein n=1 Tax=unclassified Nocardia TaxID=2637762 RepID=UPI001CE42E48|nr:MULTISPECIES: hypothetical protein [unclassified Nocardia]